ncbi:hypothetical protein V5O48_000635 [Marasmius crinis-equi]|uniref:BAG domain-containing protein n=1 Tax=Marasmius crinis-equi TaxID=585013 RepID=A0ABR3G1A6_9AGAR
MLSTLRNQHYNYPTSNLDSFDNLGFNSSPLTPRERYLASLAEAKAAEADYIAAEAERLHRDEEEILLRRRLQELEAQRRPRVDDYPSHRHPHFDHSYRSSYPQPYQSEDRLALLRRELEEEELKAARERKQERERELLRIREAREAERIALLRKEEENRLTLARRRREQEEQRLLELRRQAEAPQVVRFAPRRNVIDLNQNKPRHPSTHDFETLRARLAESQQKTHCHRHQTLPTRQAPKPTHDDALRALFGTQPHRTPAKPQEEEATIVSPNDLVKLLLGGAPQPARRSTAAPPAAVGPSAPKAPKPQEATKPTQVPQQRAPSRREAEVKAAEEFWKHLFGPRRDASAAGEVATPQDFFSALFGGQVPHQKPADKPQVAESSTSSQGKVPVQPTQVNVKAPEGSASPSTSLKQQLEARLGSDEAIEIRDTIQAVLASLADATNHETQPKASPATASNSTPAFAPAVAPERPTSPATTLKKQLETRLNNDEAVEIQDTIQAILASLADATTYQSQPQPFASAPAPAASGTRSFPILATGKGKEKVESSPTESEPTSNDVLKSMETVHNIDAAFTAIQQDFVFPTTLDFTPTSSTAPSPVSSDTENPTPTISKLAYTSRNHPIRYYEQSLSGLLSQLDGVESFGNGEVRMRRKEVVARVEGALDELEREVEGRWKVRVEKERRESPVPASHEAETPAPAADFVILGNAATAPVERGPEAAQNATTEEEASIPAPISQSVVDSSSISAPTPASAVDEPVETSTSSPAAEILETPASTAPVQDSEQHSGEAIDQAEPEAESEAQTFISPPEHETLESAEVSESSVPAGNLDSVAVAEPYGDDSRQEEVASEAVTEDSSAVAEPQPSEERKSESQDSTESSQTIDEASLAAYPPSLSESFHASSYPPTTSSSVATIRPYDAQDVETASTSSEDAEAESDSDGFLLSEETSPDDGKRRKLNKDDGDVGSDWSEVEA